MIILTSYFSKIHECVVLLGGALDLVGAFDFDQRISKIIFTNDCQRVVACTSNLE
jgi:hypothetical protein